MQKELTSVLLPEVASVGVAQGLLEAGAGQGRATVFPTNNMFYCLANQW